MVRILAGLILILAVSVGLLIFRFRQTSTQPETIKEATSAAIQNKLNSASSDADRLKTLEEAVLALTKQLEDLEVKTGTSANSSTSPFPSSIDGRIKALELSVANLQRMVTGSSTSTTQTLTTTQSTKKAPLYIPFGSSSTADDKNFISIDGFEITLNPADYEGYTSMQLEVTLRLSEVVGQANARVYNQTDNSAVSSSDISTSSDKLTLVASKGFKIADGNKIYRLQVQSTEGYLVTIQSARIKVNF